MKVGRNNVRITAVALAIALLALPGCQESAQIGPTKEELVAARQRLKEKAARAAVTPPPAPKPAAQGTPAEESFAAMEHGFHYDPKGKRDPFRSFEWEQLKLELSSLDSRGPLEQFDVNQLTVVGVVWNAKNARALVQDPSGMSYIVAEGARVGKNEGRVTHIDDNLVVVKETYVDFMGEETTKDIEMRIRPTEGG